MRSRVGIGSGAVCPLRAAHGEGKGDAAEALRTADKVMIVDLATRSDLQQVQTASAFVSKMWYPLTTYILSAHK